MKRFRKRVRRLKILNYIQLEKHSKDIILKKVQRYYSEGSISPNLLGNGAKTSNS